MGILLSSMLGFLVYLFIVRPFIIKITNRKRSDELNMSDQDKEKMISYLNNHDKESAEKFLRQLVNRLPENERLRYERTLFLYKNLKSFYWSEWLFWKVHPKGRWKFILYTFSLIMSFISFGGLAAGPVGLPFLLIILIIFDVIFYKYQLLMETTLWNKEFCNRFLNK